MMRGIRIGVCAVEFPDCRLTDEQYLKLQDSLVNAICSSSRGVHPQFHGTHFRAGWVQFFCANEGTVSWLRETIPTIVPWEGAALRILEEKEFPHRKTVLLNLPKSDESDERIQNILDSQNPEELKISSWTVFKRNDSNYTQISFLVDEDVAIRLSNGKSLFFKFKQVRYSVSGIKKDRRKKTDAGPSGVLKEEPPRREKKRGPTSKNQRPQEGNPTPLQSRQEDGEEETRGNCGEESLNSSS